MRTDNPTAPLILIVEDDDSHIELIQRAIDGAADEYRLEVAGTLLDAGKVIELHHPDLVLTDYRLPDGDGNELLLMVNDACPVIVMTSQGSEQAAVQAMKIGAQDYIVKSPEAFISLPQTVRYALMIWALKVARQQVAEAALSAKKDWERTFDAVPDLISIIDLSHTITRVNKAMAARSGLAPEELVGRRCCEVVHGTKCLPADCPVTDMVQNCGVRSAEVEERRLNGIFDVTVSPIFDEEERITSFVHVMRDITERKKTEELVRQRLRLREMAPAMGVEELMQAVLDACEAITDSSIGFFLLVDEDQQCLTLQAWSSNTLATMCTMEGSCRHYQIDRAGVWAECFHSREPVIHNDYAGHAGRHGLPSGHPPVLRELTVPIILNDRVVSIIGVGNKTSPYTEHDVYVVTQFVTFAYEIIGRKKAIIALTESEEKHRKLAKEQQAILNASSVGICFLKERKVFWANPAFDQIFGYEAGATNAMDTVELYAHRETHEYIGEEASSILESGGVFTQDVMMKRKNGALIWCNIVGQAVTPGNNKDGSIWIITDITERREMTHLLAENEIRLRTLVQTIPDLIWLKDVNGVYLFCNGASERFLGAGEADIVGKSDCDFMEKELAAAFRTQDHMAIAAGAAVSNEDWVTFAESGQRVLLEIIRTPMYVGEGRLIGVLGIARDITERKRSEKERELMLELYRLLNRPVGLNKILQEIILLLKERTGLEAVGIRLQAGDDYPYLEAVGFPAAFVEKENFLCPRDQSGNMLRDSGGNPVLSCMCGNVIRGRFDPLLPFFTDFGSFWSNGTSALLASTTEADRQGHTRNRCNAEGYESVALIPLRSGGHVFGLLQFNDHRTDCFTSAQIELFERVANTLAIALSQKKIEEERQTLEKQFQQTQKLESLGVLAGGIAHDFNNILTVILGYCYVIDNNIDPETDHRIQVRQIEKAAARAAELCRQMLSYAGKNEVTQTRINLGMLLDENVKMLQSAFKKNVSIEEELQYDMPEITGDSAQLQQVVMNLMINAAEAIGDRDGVIRVELGRSVILTNQPERDFLGNDIPGGKYACLTVADNGCGMDAESQKRIFEPFYTTKFTGRGLGMSAVIGIIKGHGGALQLSSAPGAGTTFKVYFPLADGPESAEPINDFSTLKKGFGTVLLVDDEELLRTIGSALLSAMGFSPMTAANGREALQIFRERADEIDLVLLDLIMPVMGGIETFRMLREMSPEVPVVICSGNSLDGVLEATGNDPYFALIQKPYQPDQLRNTLMKLLDNTE